MPNTPHYTAADAWRLRQQMREQQRAIYAHPMDAEILRGLQETYRDSEKFIGLVVIAPLSLFSQIS